MREWPDTCQAVDSRNRTTEGNVHMLDAETRVGGAFRTLFYWPAAAMM